MSASLVGSEMCIRDSPSRLPNRMHTFQPEPYFPLLSTIRAPRTPEILCAYHCHRCRLEQLHGGNP
eukprot:15042770-Alexandrium_andersonii.AAC.1